MSFEKLCFKIYCESGFFVNCNLPLQNFFLPTDSLIFHSHIKETRFTYQVHSLEPIQVFASGLETNKRDLLDGFTKQGSHLQTQLQKSW